MIRLTAFLDTIGVLQQDQWQYVAAVGIVLAFSAGCIVGVKL